MNKIIEALLKAGLITEENKGSFEGILKESFTGYVNISELDTKEKADEFIKTNAPFMAVFQSLLSHKNVESEAKIIKEKLPDLVKAEREKIEVEIRKELNPEESPLEKEVRELKANALANVKKDELTTLEKELLKTAEDQKYIPGFADRLAELGREKSNELLKLINDKYQEAITAIEDKYKGSGNGDPGGGNPPPPDDLKEVSTKQHYKDMGFADDKKT